jgi:hypothetical protein
MAAKNSRRIQNRIDHLFDSLTFDLEDSETGSLTKKNTNSPRNKSHLDELSTDFELVKPVFQDFSIPSPDPGHDQNHLQSAKKTKTGQLNMPFGYRIRQHSVEAIQSLSDETEGEEEIYLHIPIHHPKSSIPFEAVVKLKGVKNTDENCNLARKILSQLAMIINYSGVLVD